MNRREVIALIGLGMSTWPLGALGQQPTMPVIGFLSGGSPGAFSHFVTALRRGLSEGGYFEHRNIGIQYLWAEGQIDRLPALAQTLVSNKVTVIVAGGPPAALAAKSATSAIPIVFTSGEDPVKIGLVASYNRPGGNVTGVAALIEVLGGKRLGLLRELVPNAKIVAVLINPNEPAFETQLSDLQDAARAVEQKIVVLRASTEGEIDSAFAIAKELHASAMLVGVSFFYTVRREQIIALAARTGLPAIYGQREFMPAGGLMSYATNLADVYYQAGAYAARILRGDRPADLPVIQPTKFELLLNLKVAKTLGLSVPSSLLALADEVIE